MNKLPQITLRAARVNANLGQKEAAEMLGISVSTLRNYEKGITVPDIIMTKKIEQIYGCSMDYIFFNCNHA